MPYSINALRSPNRVDTSLRHAPGFFGILLALTCALLLWQRLGMEQVVELSARSPGAPTASSDSAAGGDSSVTLRRVGDALEMDCVIVRNKFQWPYCKMEFSLSETDAGVDLSDFDSVSVDLSHSGDGPNTAKLALLNFERDWSTPGQWQTNKPNEVDPFEIPSGRPATVPLDNFYVAAWWKFKVQPPLQRAGLHIDNVIGVELATPPEITTGHHVFTLRSIRFHGKWITKNRLLTILIGVWIASAMGWAGLLSLTLRRALETSTKQLRRLNEVNRALKLETEQLTGQAHRDPLTGVLNRQGLRAELMATSRLMADPVSIVFIDIDHFKHINDGHGHAVGDLVLRQFAATITAKVRSADRLVRWGGEEFLLLCPTCDLVQATALAEKLRLSLLETSCPEALRVTASFGVAQHDASEEIGQVIKRADEQLYRAKNSGRNRVAADTGHVIRKSRPAAEVSTIEA
ncbi:MAG: GGDEF domain-containing protein [Massilia sp.]